MASILRLSTKFQSTHLVFIAICGLNIPVCVGSQNLDTATAYYACAFVTTYWSDKKCDDLVLNCPNGTTIDIVNGLRGYSYSWTQSCSTSVRCSLKYNCCKNLQEYHSEQLSQKGKIDLSKTCNRKLQCTFIPPFSKKFMAQYQFMSVSYLCTPEPTGKNPVPESETTTHSPRTTSVPNRTTNVAAIGSQVSASMTRVKTSTTTVMYTPLWSSTTQNKISAETIKHTDSLLEPAGVSAVAVVVPSVLIPICVGIGIFMLCRKRCKEKGKSMTVDSKSDISQRNPTHANNNFECKSYVVENQSEPKGTVRYNGDTSESKDGTKNNDEFSTDISGQTYGTKINDGFSTDISGQTYVILEDQDQYTTIGNKHVSKLGPSEVDALDDDYNRIKFTSNGVSHDSNYDTMDKLPYIRGVEENEEYFHINAKQKRPNNDINYSHINVHVREASVDELGDTYSHIHVMDDKKSFESVVNNVEY